MLVAFRQKYYPDVGQYLCIDTLVVVLTAPTHDYSLCFTDLLQISCYQAVQILLCLLFRQNEDMACHVHPLVSRQLAHLHSLCSLPSVILSIVERFEIGYTLSPKSQIPSSFSQ